MIAVFDLRAEIGARLAINRDAARRDQIVAMPARAEAGSGEEAIKAQGSVRS